MMLDENTQENARARARALMTELQLPEQLQPYRAHHFSGCEGPLPTLHLDDVSAIPFLSDIPGVELYQHRARMRAKDGDLFAAVTPPSEGFEDYCAELLGWGRTEFLAATPRENLLEVAQSCREGPAFDRLLSVAKDRGLIIHPYMGIESVWTLADDLAKASQRPVWVLGPPPPVTWVANDKSLFGKLVVGLLGEQLLVNTQVADRPKDIAERLFELAKSCDRVGLKRTRCASAMGNRVWSGAEIRAMSLGGVEAEVRAFCEETEWVEGEEVLIVEWLGTDLSPSTQLWIPPAGPPTVDGIYEQLLEGETKVFLGSRPSTLPTRVNRAMAQASLQLAIAFQEMGYVGRCSFDLLVEGDVDGDFEIRFTECNGRWGGTSTPMHIVDRLVKGARPHYRAQDFIRQELVGASFAQVRERVGPSLFNPSTQTGRFILYNVGPLEGSGKLDVIALADTPQEADEALEQTFPDLLGVSR